MRSAVLENIHNFGKHALPFGWLIALNRGDDTVMQVIFQQQLAAFFQRGLHGVDLLDHVNAVAIIFQHGNHAVKMSHRAFESVNHLLPLLGVHVDWPFW